MANYKGILIGLGSTGALVGLLFGTGVVKLNKESDDSETPEASQDGGDEASGPKGKRRRGKRGRRGRRRKRNLESLAYLGSVPLAEGTADLVGVQRNEPGAYEGYMLANPAGGARADIATIREAVLYDDEGKEVHRWGSDVPTKSRGWAMARLDSSGFLYAVVADAGLLKLDWESNVAWVTEGLYHHDLTILENGDVATLAERLLVVDGPQGGQKVRVLDHGVVFFHPDGTSTEQIWLHEIMKDEPVFKAQIARAVRNRGRIVVAKDEADRRGGTIDAFHANSVVILPRDVDGLGKKGDVLLSLRNLDTVVTIDRQSNELLWSWGSGELIRQHDATLTADDDIVLFDNRTRRQNSRAVVVDPPTRTIVRTIGGRDASGTLKFFSKGRGLAQFLPGGNIMVIVSNEGRAFEVDDEDQVLWEMWSPWKDEHTRKPIRGTRLEGPIQEGVAAVVTGQTPPPRVEGGKVVSLKVDFGVDDHHDDDAKTDDYGDTDGAEDGDDQAEVETPTGQDTPVPPNPQ